MKVPTMTVGEMEARLGPRGHFVTNRDNRWDVRKWLTAQGLQSHFVNRLSYAELAQAYNDQTGGALTALRTRMGIEPLAPIVEGEAEAEAGDIFDAPAPKETKANGHDRALAVASINQGAPAPSPVDVQNVAAMLAQLFAQQQKPALDVDAVRQIVREEVTGIKPRPIEIKVNDGPAVLLKERCNPVFDRVLKLVAAGANIMLVGPAGCGKSHLSYQIARALDAEYGAIHGTAGASESALTGWLLPSDGGKFEYVPSRFVTLYEKGNSLFCFDEMDAFDPNMLLVVNGATDNGHIHIAHRREMPATPRGKNVRLMATANTYGTGASPLYTGRAALDGATNDRWMIVTVDYDTALESDIGTAAGLTPAEMSSLWNLRTKVREGQLRRIVSTRAFKKAGMMKASGDTWATVMDTLTQGWTRDERAKVGL